MSTDTSQRPSTADPSVREMVGDTAGLVKELIRLEIQLITVQAKTTLLRAAVGIGLVLAAVLMLMLFVVTYIGVLAEANSVVDDWAAGAALASLVLAAACAGLSAWIGRAFRFGAALFGLAVVVFIVMQIVLSLVFEGRRGWAIGAVVLLVLTLSLLGAGGLLIWRAVRRGLALRDDVTGLPGFAKQTVERTRDSWRRGSADS